MRFWDLYLKVFAHRFTEPVRYFANGIFYKEASNPIYKRKTVFKYGKDNECNVLVETGTYLGEMPEYQRCNFEVIKTIEVTELFSSFSKRRLKKYRNIEVIMGDSGEVLREILPSFSKEDKLLFWLDGHYSGGKTGRGKKDCPIFEELQCIFDTRGTRDVILIDDARCFDESDNGYPSLNELMKFVLANDSKAKYEVKNDIIRVLL